MLSDTYMLLYMYLYRKIHIYEKDILRISIIQIRLTAVVGPA